MTVEISKRADLISARIREHAELRNTAKVSEGLRTRLDKLVTGTRAVGPISSSHSILAECDIILGLTAVPLADITECLSEVRKAFDQDPMSITQPHGGRKYSFWQLLESVPIDLRGALLASWQSHIDGQAPTIDPALLQVLAQVPALSARVESVKGVLQDLHERRARLPVDEAAVQSARRAAQALRQSWSDLVGEGIPDEVEMFLQRVSAGNALLVDVTSVVKNWLAANALEGQMRITLLPGPRR